MLSASTDKIKNLNEFLGEDILAQLMLAIGGALAGGTAMALIRPRPNTKEGELDKPPLGRSVLQITIGLVVVIWALASLFG